MWKNDQVSQAETQKILEMAERCLAVSGDFVEMGCYRGDTSLLLAEVVYRGARLRQEVRCSVGVHSSTPPPAPSSLGIHVRTTSKRLWLYDSFEGLPEKTSEDASEVGREFVKGALAVSKREVKARFLRAGLPVPVIKKAWFSELVPEDLPEKIAFAFIDGDLYGSIRDALRLVKPKMSSGGIIIVHDYNNPALPGVAKAVDESWQEEVTIYNSMAILKIG